MQALARKRAQPREVNEDVGSVIWVDEGTLVIRTDGGELRAKRATSCLLEPVPGDLVLVALVSTGPVYVLAVLEREAGAPSTITVDGDLDIKLRTGSLGLAAQEGVRVTSGKQVSVVSGAVHVNAVDGNVALERLSFLGTFFQAEIAKAKLVAGTFDTLLDRLSQRVKRSYRVVEETDQLRAQRIDYSAKKSLSLHAENTLITSEELVKVDGEQIHLG